MTALSEVQNDPNYKQYLDHGFVGFVESMGSDESIERAARMSYGQGTRQKTETRALLRYLLRHHHTSPFEMGEVIFHLKVPIFVMRQLVRHRTASLNEYSGRYSEMTDEFYTPDPSRLQAQSTVNKQGSGAVLDQPVTEKIKDVMEWVQTAAYHNYQLCLENGLSRELSRIVLPVSNYTELYWKCDLNNLFKFLRLRLDPHAPVGNRAACSIDV
jgi:thymidylate synthase (FAD)